MLPSWSNIFRDEVYIPNFIPNLVTSTFIGYLFHYLLDPVCIKLVGWNVSFVFPDRIQIPKRGYPIRFSESGIWLISRPGFGIWFIYDRDTGFDFSVFLKISYQCALFLLVRSHVLPNQSWLCLGENILLWSCTRAFVLLCLPMLGGREG